MTIYDVNDLQLPWNGFLLTSALFIILFILCYYYYNFKVFKVKKTKQISVLLLWSIPLSLTIAFSYFLLIGRLLDLQSVVINKQCIISDGLVENLTKGADGKEDTEYFAVDKIIFKYSPHDLNYGFNDLLTDSGLVKNGDHIKLCYIQRDSVNLILQFYLYPTR